MLTAGMELFLVRRGSGEVSWESDPNGRTFHFCVELVDVNSTWSKLVRAISLHALIWLYFSLRRTCAGGAVA